MRNVQPQMVLRWYILIYSVNYATNSSITTVWWWHLINLVVFAMLSLFQLDITLQWLISWFDGYVVPGNSQRQNNHTTYSFSDNGYLQNTGWAHSNTLSPPNLLWWRHMSATIYRITGNLTVCSTACPRTKQRIHQSSALLFLCKAKPPVTSGFPSQRESNEGCVSIGKRDDVPVITQLRKDRILRCEHFKSSVSVAEKNAGLLFEVRCFS